MKLNKGGVVGNSPTARGKMALHSVPLDTPVSVLDCTAAFKGLTDKEKLYAHHLCRASWAGSLICLLQTSPEAGPIFLLLQRLFTHDTPESLRAACEEDGTISKDDFEALLMYAAFFFTNMGNYKSFGDTKVVPSLGKEMFGTVVKVSAAYKDDPGLTGFLWEACADAVYSLESHEKQLAFPNQGITTYYSCNCCKDDAEFVQEFMLEKGISSYNTRLFKTDGPQYELRLASAATSVNAVDDRDSVAALLGSHVFKGVTVEVKRGDYAPLMSAVVGHLTKAKEYAASDTQAAMLEAYIHSFAVGSVDSHKEGSGHWIKDKGPIVETYIGFIESYRDPFGVRGEWEGFVAMVNKQMSSKFGRLVQKAEDLLSNLPWGTDFEKDHFLRPDFTSLDVLTFAGSGIPAGINIPNYDDIRQNEGFKNVSLGNVLSASFQDKRVTFLADGDQDVFQRLKGPSFEVQVGLHELLGHGSGKLLRMNKDGQLNFDDGKVVNPLTNSKVTSWYKDKQTFDTQFSEISSSYEECRAECVGIFLCLNKDVLSIFGHEGDRADDVAYVNWLSMVRAGVLGLEFYSPETNKWRQAHMQARYVILRVLQEVEGLVDISETVGADGEPDLLITLDRSRIESEGKAAVGHFLLKLQVYKSTADSAAAGDLYAHYSTVDKYFLKLREIVLARKIPRRMFVQPHTECNGNTVELVEFDPSSAGIVKSFAARFPEYCADLQALWEADRNHW